MQLFYNASIDNNTKAFTFDKSESKHIIKVLRKSEGDQLSITNGKGDFFEIIILTANPKKCIGEVINIKSVDHCVLSIDQDRTVCKTIEKIALDFGETYDLSFANGGDQNNNTIPERPICDQKGINLVDGLGDKIQSSSWLLKK